MHKKYTLTQLTQGLDVTINGNADCLIDGVCTIQEGRPGRITFLMNPLYKKYLANTVASAVIVTADDASECTTNTLVCCDPYYIYTQIAAFFDDRPKPQPGIHPTASIGNHCQIDPSASIGANCVINDNVRIDANAIIGAGCVIGEFSEIGEGTRLDANVTLYHKIKIGKHA